MDNDPTFEFSVVIPVYNEVNAIEATLLAVVESHQGRRFEIIAVNDGSKDGSREILDTLSEQIDALHVVHHEQNRGYGAALKTGIRRARSDLIAITDADGTYPNERIGEFADACSDQDMIVGARVGDDVEYSKIRAIPKYFLRMWVSWLARQTVPDINSGFRVFRKSHVDQYFGILPDAFSFTITITLAMLTNFHRVRFIPISYKSRTGESKIKPIRDTMNFILLILRTGVYFAPIRAFTPVFLFLFVATLLSLSYDLFIARNLTDKTVLFALFTLNAGMFMLIADMIDKRTK